ncbi:unnamed protein product [Lepeophtheirus salmonis]|uniref:(salmon louse) hypothetical protein n=1 Tax=Lepeophtheirus salmonis TaxID=72036 RepID=A0A7R8CK96_LEPSM|nr:unnamed protein product [Lepeophtheirus salmonis]CAF2847897.1 unnamed protein product [Lepeophtheirus salmonis]
MTKNPPYMDEKKTFTLTCDVRNLGDRYVSWLRGTDLQVISSGWTKFTGNRRVSIVPADRSHTWKLVIRNITPKDSGQYLCQVNTEPKISQINYLKVAESFADIKGNSERGVQRGSTLELHCLISQSIPVGQTLPPITWSRDNYIIHKNDKVDIQQGVTNPKENTIDSRLKIEYVQPSDAGVYSCKSQGAAEAKVTVLVTSGEQRAAILDENGSGSGTSDSSFYFIRIFVPISLYISLFGL